MKETISEKQGVSMIVMFLIGSSSLMVMGLAAKKDIWAAVLLAFLAGLIMVSIFARLLSILPGCDIYKTLEFFLGKIMSKIVIALLTYFALSLCGIVLRNFGQFISTVALPQIPLVINMAFLLLVCVYAVKLGVECIGRWSQIFVYILIGFFAISVVLLIGFMKIENILPPFEEGFAPIVEGAIDALTFPFAETVLFLLAFPAFQRTVSPKKVYIKGLCIGAAVLYITSLAEVLAVGVGIASRMYYPTYSTISIIHIGDFIQRLEVVMAVVFVLALFPKVTVLLLASTKGVSNLLGFKDYRFLVFPVALVVLNLACFRNDSMLYFHEFSLDFFAYNAAPFEIVVPVLTWIFIEIKLRIIKKKSPEKLAAFYRPADHAAN